MNEILDGEKQPFLSQESRKDGVPEKTRWKSLFCPYCPVWHANDRIYQLRFRYSFFQFYPNRFIFYWICFVLFVWFYSIGPYFWPVHKFLYISFSIISFLNVWSFLASEFQDPGYLPFDYFANPRRKYTLNEIKSGTAITEEQIKYARSKKRLGRMIFSKNMGVYILRADHYCPYIGSFVGAYNQHAFSLFTLYATINSAMILITAVYAYNKYNALSTKSFIGYFIIMIILGSIAAKQAWRQFISLTFNFTFIDEIRGHPMSFYDKGSWFKNWEEFCGKRQYLLLWPFPIRLPLPVDVFNFAEAPSDVSCEESTDQEEEQNDTQKTSTSINV